MNSDAIPPELMAQIGGLMTETMKQAKDMAQPLMQNLKYHSQMFVKRQEVSDFLNHNKPINFSVCSAPDGGYILFYSKMET